MKNRWIKIILAASLALNLAFGSTLVYKNFFKKKSLPGADIRLDTQLKLQEEQKKGIDLIIKRFRINLVRFKQDILEKRMDIIDELGNPDFDLESIKVKTEELNELEDQLNLAFVDTLVQLTHILDSRQRLNFLYELSQNWFFIKKNASNE